MADLRLVIFDVEGTLLESLNARPETRRLYPGARAALGRLLADPFTLLGVATGTSKRRLDALIVAQGLEGVFDTTQTSDHHPSKPHPGMLLACLSETGVAAQRAVMVGDTRFDMDMARAAGVRCIGVGWGHPAPEALTADAMIGDFAALDAAVDGLIGQDTEQDT
jgi:phosphoglycolate phosphatase